MARDSDRGPTRRTFVTGAAGLIGCGAVAGCIGGDGDGTAEPTSGQSDGDGTPGGATDTATATATAAPTESATDATATATDTPSSGPYSVSIEPMGDVTFEAVPETWLANNGSWADMGIALGQDPPEGVWLSNRYHTQYYDDIPGVSVDGSEIESLFQDSIDVERFYAIDADVHVMDPNFLVNRFNGVEQDDVDQIRNDVAPFFGNSIFSTGYDWHTDYRYYSLYEAFEKLADVFQERARYEAFAALHDEFQTELEDVVPDDESERPLVAIMWADGDAPDEYSPYLISEGTSFKQWRDLGVRDAFDETEVHDFHSERIRVDYETLLKINPDVLLLRGQEHKTRSEFEDTIVSHLENHTVASSLTAVRNDDVYRGGSLYQGPITNLVLTERAASQVYGVERELFDRERVGNIVNGNL